MSEEEQKKKGKRGKAGQHGCSEAVRKTIDPSLVKSGRGKGAIKVSDDEIRQIETMAGMGLRADDISLILGFSKATLYNKAKEDPRILDALHRGHANSSLEVMKTAYSMATSGKSVAMTIFWLKARQNWSDVPVREAGNVQQVVFKTRIGEKGEIVQEQTESALKVME